MSKKKNGNGSSLFLNRAPIIWVRGAGELGSATAVSLFRAGFPVFMSEINPPLAIRRSVTFSDAILEGKASVEGIESIRYEPESLPSLIPGNHIPLINDKEAEYVPWNTEVLIDARMIKHYEQDYRNRANFVLGLGPGFSARENCHAVIETMRGHSLGQIIWEGKPIANTGIPGVLGGETKRRVIRAPLNGKVIWQVELGEIVNEGQVLGTMGENVKLRTPFPGIVRGLIHPTVRLTQGLKIADVDPRGEKINFLSISDKSRSIARAALEAVLIFISSNDL